MKNFKVHLVPVIPEDLEKLCEISYQTFYDSFAWGNTEANMKAYVNLAFSEETLLKEINDPGSAFYFALYDEISVGYLKINTGISQTDLKNENALEVARIYVRKNYQGKQIGKQMLDKAILIANEKMVDYIWLGVWEKNPDAIRFYEKNGFVKYGSHHFMVGNDRQTDIIMRLNRNV